MNVYVFDSYFLPFLGSKHHLDKICWNKATAARNFFSEYDKDDMSLVSWFPKSVLRFIF